MSEIRKYTPEPWHQTRPQKTNNGMTRPISIEAENPLPGDGEMICTLGLGILNYANADANARLIAATPELLEALKDLLCLFPCGIYGQIPEHYHEDTKQTIESAQKAVWNAIGYKKEGNDAPPQNHRRE